jgi:hypothetical protein
MRDIFALVALSLLPSAVVADSWDSAKLSSMSSNNAENCYIALFAEKCGTSNGGVYQITPAWYTGHFGGPFGSKRSGAGTCGNVIEDWFGISSGHGAYGENLKQRTDIPDRAEYVEEFLCDPDSTVAETSPATTASVEPATTAAATTEITTTPTCPAGTYSANGNAPCTNCQAGTISESSGATTCTTCPAGTISAAGASSCSSTSPPTGVGSGSDTTPSSPNPGATAPPPTGVGSGSDTTPSSPNPGGHSNDLSGGEIAGIAVGSVAGGVAVWLGARWILQMVRGGLAGGLGDTGAYASFL